MCIIATWSRGKRICASSAVQGINLYHITVFQRQSLNIGLRVVWQLNFNPSFFSCLFTSLFCEALKEITVDILLSRRELAILYPFLWSFISDWESHIEVKSSSLCGKTTNMFSHFQAVPNAIVWFPNLFFLWGTCWILLKASELRPHAGGLICRFVENTLMSLALM